MEQSTRQQDENINVFMKACEYHEAGNYQEAASLYEQLLKHIKDNWFLHYNFGLLLFETGRYSEALSHYMQAAALEKTSNDLYYNLALCQKQCGLLESAVISYKKAIHLEPEDTECRYNLANCFLALDRPHEAIVEFNSVLKLDPLHQSALNNLAYSYHREGVMDQAIYYYKRLLEVNPAHCSADHMVASLTGQQRASAPLSYVQEVFDNYSIHYEDSLLHKLHYTLPQQLQSFISLSSGKDSFIRAIDIGCGTGLLGAVLRATTKILDGIDLSPKMIEIAEQKNLYDNLITGDINTMAGILENKSYDLLVAADVLTYIGDLVPTFQAAYSIASSESVFFFSVENLEESFTEPVLRKSGRFAHSQSYVKRAALQTGWQTVQFQNIDLRKESGKWIKGVIFGFKKIT